MRTAEAGLPSAYAANLRAAFADLLSREFAPSTGHLAALVNGCVFAPSLVTFWFVNGVLDFSTAFLLRTANSLLLGPIAVAGFAAAMNRVLTRPELTGVPLVRHTLPRRDPDRVVIASAMLGTVFYLGVVALATGRVVVLP